MPAASPLVLHDLVVRRIEYLLRATVVLQCLGNARWLLAVGNTPLFALLFSPPAAGGWGVPEPMALRVETIVGWCVLVAAVWVLLRPATLCLLMLSALQIVIAWGMASTGIGFFPIVSGVPAEIASLFPLGSQLSRVAAPLSLALLRDALARGASSEFRLRVTEAILRCAVAATFVLHGLEAIQHYPVFIDLIVASSSILEGWSISETAARTMLTIVGWIDVLVGLLVMLRRWPLVAGYMCLWGLATSLSRLFAEGPTMIHEVLTRLPHAGVPLVLALYWRELRNDKNSA